MSLDNTSDNPIPLDAKRFSQAPFPDLSAAPTFAAAVADASRVTSATIPVAVLTALGCAALCVQGVANVRGARDRPPMPTSLFVVGVADTGAFKTSLLGQAKRGIDAHVNDRMPRYEGERQAWHEAGKKAGECPVSPVRERGETTTEALVKDLGGLAHPSLGLVSDEGSRALGNHAMEQKNVATTLARLASAYSGSTLASSTVTHGAIAATEGRYRLSIIWLMQSGGALRMFSGADAQSIGTAWRFLLARADPEEVQRLAREAADRELQDAIAGPSEPRATPGLDGLAAAQRRLLEAEERRTHGRRLDLVTLDMAPEARRFWATFLHETRTAPGMAGDARYSRAAENAARVAGVLAMTEAAAAVGAPAAALSGKALDLTPTAGKWEESVVIGEPIMRLAVEIVRWCVADALELADTGEASELIETARDVLARLERTRPPIVDVKWFRDHGPAKLDRGTGAAENRAAVMAVLVERGWVDEADPSRKHSPRWAISPGAERMWEGAQ